MLQVYRNGLPHIPGLIKGDNYPYALTTDARGNVYVTGRSMGNNSHYDIATVKYDSSGATTMGNEI
jgi:hypothetical protein